MTADFTPNKPDHNINLDEHHRSDGEEIQEPIHRIVRGKIKTPSKINR
jgi:hypothetical protein